MLSRDLPGAVFCSCGLLDRLGDRVFAVPELVEVPGWQSLPTSPGNPLRGTLVPT